MNQFPNVFQFPFAVLQEKGFEMKGRWNELFFGNDHPVVLELGCGKGEYTVGLAKLYPEKNFIGIDIKGARMWTGAKQSQEEGLKNVAFLRTHIELIDHFFGKEEVSEIWITFPDPQMSKVNKRMTSTRFMKLYRNILKPNGLIHLKSDSNFMYTYTQAMAKANNFPILVDTNDLYNSDIADKILSIRTYYEQQWLDRGLNIKYIQFELPAREEYIEPDVEIEHDSYRSFNRSKRSSPTPSPSPLPKRGDAQSAEEQAVPLSLGEGLGVRSVIDALKNVRYPGTGKNIIEMGMLEDDMRIEGNKVSFSLIFDKPNDPFMKSVVKASETAILTYISEAVEIKGNIQTKAKQAPRPEPDKLLPQVKNVIAIASGKGGVGKSTVSANLAVALAQRGYKVGLLDADIFGPSIPKMFGEEAARPYMTEVDGRELIEPVYKYGVKILSIGFFVDKDNALLWRGTMASNALRQLIADAHWGDLDFLLLDMPPGTSDIHLTLVQTLAVTGVAIVSTPQEVALADARKGINMFANEKVNVPILGLIENMAWFTPAELPENKYYLFGKEGVKRLADEMNVPLLGQIPIVQRICEGGDQGKPVALNEDSITGKAFLSLADQLVQQVEHRNKHQEATQRVIAKHK